MSLVCLDTMIMVWGVHQTSKPTQAHEIRKAIALLEQLEREKVNILIPTVALGEFLIKIPTEHHLTTINQFTRRFLLAPYDAQTASVFATIWANKNPEIAELIEDIPRATLRADCMIVATAVARNADCIYSHDPGLKKFADGYIEVCELPNNPIQLTLDDT